jgi:hypothetical protein
LYLQIEFKSEKRVVFTSSPYLQGMIEQVPGESFPFRATIIKDENGRYEFT